MVTRTATASILALAIAAGGALAEGSRSGQAASEFKVVTVSSLSEAGTDLKPGTILFNDRRPDQKSDRGAFIAFADWARTKPVEKRLLSLYPGFTEGTTHRITDGIRREVQDTLSVYVTEARFKLSKPAEKVDLSPFATLAFIKGIDPAIQHTSIRPDEITVLKDERAKSNRNPERPWCEGTGVAACMRSSYKLEGRLPVGVALANRLRESGRQLSDTVVFESEMRLLSGADLDEAGVRQLTGIDTPVAGVVEQNMFYVNQILRFGKLMAVIQADPRNPETSIATVMIALAVSTSTLDTQKKYQDVPVLRNLVPSQVLLGQSSFNTGDSISAGLPQYVRNRIKAIATMLNRV